MVRDTIKCYWNYRIKHRWNPTARFRITFLVVLACMAAPAIAATDVSQTNIVFRQHADRVIKLRVVDQASGAKSSMGSAFFVSADGYLITNFHVISQLVHHPEKYRAELLDADEQPHPAQLLNIDVIHDLAVIRSTLTPPAHFNLRPTRPEQGDRLYALGYPHDLGITIVEGTYNGPLEHALYPKIHFTGSLNPGMSGGPTIDGRGQVVGVNVSTAGNQVSFLVPIQMAQTLLAATTVADYQTPTDFIAVLREQLLAHQARYLGELNLSPEHGVTLGNFLLPTAPAKFFNCWGDTSHQENDPYRITVHQCSTEDYLYISGQQLSGTIQFKHHLLTSKEPNAFRFARLYGDHFSGAELGLYGDEDDLTRFRCNTETVIHEGTPFKTVLCVRRYKKMEGLYDAVFKAASLSGQSSGVLTELALFGVSFDKAVEVSRTYLEAIRWKH